MRNSRPAITVDTAAVKARDLPPDKLSIQYTVDPHGRRIHFRPIASILQDLRNGIGAAQAVGPLRLLYSTYLGMYFPLLRAQSDRHDPVLCG